MNDKKIKRNMFTPNEIIKYENYAEVCLYNRKCKEIARTKIDLKDIEKIKKCKWCLTSNGYVSGSNGEFLHRFIMKCPDHLEIDHINHDTLDNRRCNLRVCTRQENNMNKGLYNHNTSGVTGVTWDKEKEKWKSQIKINNENRHLGYFKNKEKAIKIRKKAEKELFGEFRFDFNLDD